MRRLLLWALLGVIVSPAWVCAEGYPQHYPKLYPMNHGFGPHTTSVTWPSAVPPGWYSNTYNYRWFYPWFAYYNYSSSPYANWRATNAVAGYAYHGPAGIAYMHQPVAQPYLGAWYGGSGPGSYNSLQGMTTPQQMTPPKPPEVPKDKK